MPYVLVKQAKASSNLTFIIIGLALLALWLYSRKKEYFRLHPEMGESMVCSKKCCFTGWPNAVSPDDDKVSDREIGVKYTTSNINCNDGVRNTGCLCLPKQ